MKTIIISLVTLAILLSSVTTVSASGGKERGDKGTGKRAQVCSSINTVRANDCVIR